MASGVEGEDQTGPILSLMAARQFDRLFLFHTRHTLTNAGETSREVGLKHPECRVVLQQLPDSDPKNASLMIRQLSRQVDKVMRESGKSENHVCMSSGTTEMRAALVFLVAAGVLPAKLLQVGSPTERLFGGPNVKEVRLDAPDGSSLRELVVPPRSSRPPDILHQGELLEAEPAAAAEDQSPELEDALKELHICIGSKKMVDAAKKIETAAPTNVPILILGETGTGKDLFARLVHRLSDRRNRDFVAVNCAVGSKDLLESDLFGHVTGAFTGATDNRKGKFERADKGTLFLDEIGELPLEAQAKLLRVLKDGMIEPVGAQQARKVDVRIVAATNRTLQKEMADEQFRPDLYYRLQTFEVKLPPLRERREEIPQLALTLLRHINQELKRQKTLAKDSLSRLMLQSWPGNVHELENVLKKSVLLSKGNVIEPEDLKIDTTPPGKGYLDLLPPPSPEFSLNKLVDAVEDHQIRIALSMCGENGSQAGKLLGRSRQSINQRKRRWNS